MANAIESDLLSSGLVVVWWAVVIRCFGRLLGWFGWRVGAVVRWRGSAVARW